LLITKWDNWLSRHEKSPTTNKLPSGIADPFEIQFNLSDFFALTFFYNALFPVSLIQIGRVRSKSQWRGRFLFVVDHRRTVACNDFQFTMARRHNTNVTCFRANYNYQYFHGAACKNVLETRPHRSQCNVHCCVHSLSRATVEQSFVK